MTAQIINFGKHWRSKNVLEAGVIDCWKHINILGPKEFVRILRIIQKENAKAISVLGIQENIFSLSVVAEAISARRYSDVYDVLKYLKEIKAIEKVSKTEIKLSPFGKQLSVVLSSNKFKEVS